MKQRQFTLDEMIMDIEVTDRGDRIRIKFLAIAGGTGPELNVPPSLAYKLFQKLGQLTLVPELR